MESFQLSSVPLQHDKGQGMDIHHQPPGKIMTRNNQLLLKKIKWSAREGRTSEKISEGIRVAEKQCDGLLLARFSLRDI